MNKNLQNTCTDCGKQTSGDTCVICGLPICRQCIFDKNEHLCNNDFYKDTVFWIRDIDYLDE